MCGIAGFIGKKILDEETIAQTLNLMKNRGPDNQDYYFNGVGSNQVYLLHSRLSIIDLEERANQPWTIDDCTIVFNGEIYNYVEIRNKLELKGVKFTTTSDTEVLLRSYLEYGEECVKLFEGMWSFAIFDSRNCKLILSRDRFAEKPLYYFKSDTGIYFGSEIKFIKSLSETTLHVNNNQLLRYLVNGYKSLYKQDETYFQEIQEVPYASNMVINLDQRINTYRYWKPQCNIEEMSLDYAVEGFRERLLDSIKLRLRADVPMAFCLSGGVDSSAIVSIAAKVFNYDVATFSIIDDDERYNEMDNIQATVQDLGCKNTAIYIPQDGFLKRLQQQIEYHDIPVCTISYYIHSFLSKSIAEQGYRVVASGTGADELVTGYFDHFNLHLYEMRNDSDYQAYLDGWKQYIEPIVRNPFLQDPELYQKSTEVRDHIYLNNDLFATYLKIPFSEGFTEKKYYKGLLRNRMLNELFHEVVPPILREDDLNSMYYSIENRSPYLDTRLFEFAYSIPDEHLMQRGYGKYILREAVKGLLNDKVRLDHHKKGFNASIHSLVDFDNQDFQDFLLDNSPIYDIVRKEKIEEALKMKPMPNSFSKFVFNFINAKLFLDNQ
ncbi:MAG: asparagine synthase (glutamine-hydrolyzing) [Acidobacteriota bacterium]